jgi:hypothetical protein
MRDLKFSINPRWTLLSIAGRLCMAEVTLFIAPSTMGTACCSDEYVKQID